MLLLFVKGTGGTVPVEVDPGASCQDALDEYVRITGTRAAGLAFNGRRLVPSEALSEQGLSNEATLEAVTKTFSFIRLVGTPELHWCILRARVTDAGGVDLLTRVEQVQGFGLRNWQTDEEQQVGEKCTSRDLKGSLVDGDSAYWQFCPSSGCRAVYQIQLPEGMPSAKLHWRNYGHPSHKPSTVVVEVSDDGSEWVERATVDMPESVPDTRYQDGHRHIDIDIDL
eukprot:TRINITY_DN397_c0_g1_i7.p1 TRINITY_DN397_c0_g1~~TRINITY_DN397_c0_g1_i7.p1  ORF type:complete len:226 (+),score=64.02 TRINITY_DN397_c0_g1_i7:52-729(+)